MHSNLQKTTDLEQILAEMETSTKKIISAKIVREYRTTVTESTNYSSKNSNGLFLKAFKPVEHFHLFRI